MNVNLNLPELHFSSQSCTDETKESRVKTPRTSGRTSLLRARTFARMNNQEQRSFIAQRFERVDAQELTNIFRAIYGRPADKGKPTQALAERTNPTASSPETQ